MSMKFAIQRCCTTSRGLHQYEASSNAILRELGVEIVDVKGFNCCGYPLKNFNFKAYVLASTRNLALAEKNSLDVITVCNCCYGSLRRARHVMGEGGSMREEINETLEKEGLRYEGRTQAKHLLQVLHDEVGIEEIKKRIKKTFTGLKVATHYGCHALRPSNVVGFDNPLAPTKFDRLVELTGAESIPWQSKLDCCGSPILGVNDELSMDLTAKKIAYAKQAGADCLCVACPYCHYQFDRVQKTMGSRRNTDYSVPSILYPQLLGLSLGIDEAELGLGDNRLPLPFLSAA